MSPLAIQLVPILEDNYAFVLADAAGRAVVVDPGVAGPIEAELVRQGLRLEAILLTHHHGDHIAGTDALRAATGAVVIGNRADRAGLPRLDREIGAGERFLLLGSEVLVLDTPGHCAGHVSYHLPAEGAVFCGDTLFTMGCGRIIDGTAPELWGSLGRLMALPDATLTYCGHEYTLANARFAVHAFPENAAIAERFAAMQALRAKGLPTVPTTIGEERVTNPFWLAGGLARFAELREAKNRFRG